MSTDVTRTTVALPKELLDAVDQVVDTGIAKSRNDLLATALRQYLATRRRAAIDTAFAGMASDTEYLTEADVLDRGLDRSSWEALQAAESP
jgi:metal-responsive CopG/Arc/MetJ family transcriptional regulator